MAGSHTNNLPTPTNLTENPSGSVIAPGIVVEVQPRRLSFEKCYHLRDKAGVLTLITPVGFALTHTVGLEVRYYYGAGMYTKPLVHVFEYAVCTGTIRMTPRIQRAPRRLNEKWNNCSTTVNLVIGIFI